MFLCLLHLLSAFLLNYFTSLSVYYLPVKMTPVDLLNLPSPTSVPSLTRLTLALSPPIFYSLCFQVKAVMVLWLLPYKVLSFYHFCCTYTETPGMTSSVVTFLHWIVHYHTRISLRYRLDWLQINSSMAVINVDFVYPMSKNTMLRIQPKLNTWVKD